MRSTTAGETDQATLELRPSSRPLAVLALVVLVGGIRSGADLLWPRDRFALVVGGIGCVGMIVVLVALLVVAARDRTSGWRVRLDADGVTVRGSDTVPWCDLEAVRLRAASRGSSQRLVVFVPRPGVVLPAVPVSLPMSRAGARARSWTRRFGSPIALNPIRVGVSADEIAAAVQRLSNVPIVRA